MTVRHDQLRVWQQARALAGRCYRALEGRREFWLRDQTMRAALSVMNNIAEGFARGSDADFARFLDYARSSACEVQSSLALALDIGVVDTPTHGEIVSGYDATIAGIARLQDYLKRGRVGETTEVYIP